MENLKLIDQIYELEASCAAMVEDAKRRAQEMEINARQEAEKAMAEAVHEVHENKKNVLASRKNASPQSEGTTQITPDYAKDLEEARGRKALAVAALVERTLG